MEQQAAFAAVTAAPLRSPFELAAGRLTQSSSQTSGRRSRDASHTRTVASPFKGEELRRESRRWVGVAISTSRAPQISSPAGLAAPAPPPVTSASQATAPVESYVFSHGNLGVYRNMPLGVGSFGAVYPARIERGLSVGKNVIVKESNTDEYGMYFGIVERYMNEKLGVDCGEHIAKYLGSYSLPNGGLGLVWETEGTETLKDCLDKENWLDELEAAMYGRSFAFEPAMERHRRVVKDIARQLMQALSALHARSIVHRDIKPENILLVGGGRMKLIDLGCSVDVGTGFGLAKDWGAGDLRYLAPERLINRFVFPDRFDLYSAAIVLLQVAVPALRDDVALMISTDRLKRGGYNMEEWIKGQGNARPEDDKYGVDGLALLFDDEKALFNMLKRMIARQPFQRISADACLADTRFLAGPEAEAAAAQKSPLARLFGR